MYGDGGCMGTVMATWRHQPPLCRGGGGWEAGAGRGGWTRGLAAAPHLRASVTRVQPQCHSEHHKAREEEGVQHERRRAVGESPVAIEACEHALGARLQRANVPRDHSSPCDGDPPEGCGECGAPRTALHSAPLAEASLHGVARRCIECQCTPLRCRGQELLALLLPVLLLQVLKALRAV